MKTLKRCSHPRMILRATVMTASTKRDILILKVPIETNNILFLQGSEILKSENSMLEKIQKGAQILYCSP